MCDSPSLAALLTRLNAHRDLPEPEVEELDEVVRMVVALWRDLLQVNTCENSKDAARSGAVLWFVRVGGYDTVTALLRTLLREKQAHQHHGWGGRLNTSDWRLAMHRCCDLLIAGGQTGKVWPQRNSSMFERAEAVCVPVDLLTALVQDGSEDRQAGDLLKVVAVLTGIWQQSKQEIHMMLRHNVLQALSHAVAVPDMPHRLDRLAASCLLTDILCSTDLKKLRYSLPLEEVASNLLQALRLTVNRGDQFLAEKAVRNVVTCLQAVSQLPRGLDALQGAAEGCGGMRVLQRLLATTQDGPLRRDILYLLQSLAPPAAAFSRGRGEEADLQATSLLASFPHLSFLAACMSWMAPAYPSVDKSCD